MGGFERERKRAWCGSPILNVCSTLPPFFRAAADAKGHFRNHHRPTLATSFIFAYVFFCVVMICFLPSAQIGDRMRRPNSLLSSPDLDPRIV